MTARFGPTIRAIPRRTSCGSCPTYSRFGPTIRAITIGSVLA